MDLNEQIDHGMIRRGPTGARKFGPWGGNDKVVCVSDVGDASPLCPGTPLSPVRSIAQAYDLLGPLGRDAEIRIAGAGPHAMPRWRPSGWRRIVFWGTDSGFQQDGINELATGTFAAGSTLGVLKLNGSFTEDQHRQRFLKIDSGAIAGWRRMVAYHAAHEAGVTDITPSCGISAGLTGDGIPVSAIPSAGDLWTLFRPSVRIDISAVLSTQNASGFRRTSGYDLAGNFGSGTAHSTGHHDGQQGCVAFVNLGFDQLYTGDHCFPAFGGIQVYFYGCEYIVGPGVNKSGGFIFSNCVVGFGEDHGAGATAQLPCFPPFNAPAYATGGAAWAGYGFAMDSPTAQNTSIQMLASFSSGYLALRGSASGCSFSAQRGSLCALDGACSLYEGGVSASYGGQAFVGDASGVRAKIKNTGSLSGLSASTSGHAFTSTVDITCNTGRVLAASTKGQVNANAGCVGASAVGSVSVRAQTGGAVLFAGVPLVGHASDPDYDLGAGGLAVNKTFFSAARSGISDITGSTIARTS